jgi:hypothetical protein
MEKPAHTMFEVLPFEPPKVGLREAPIRNQRGGVSIGFVFVMILIFTTLGAVSYSIMTTDNRITLNYLEGVQAQYMAEAGIEYGVKLIFNGLTADETDTVHTDDGSFVIDIVRQDSVRLDLTSTGTFDDAKKAVLVKVLKNLSVSDIAILATGEVDNVDTLDENGDPDSTLLAENWDSFPDIDIPALIDTAIAQGHVETDPEFNPSHGYPNFNFYFSGSIPNVTHIQGDLRVQGGRTIYGIFVVEGDITLDGSSRVEGVLVMIPPTNVVIHGGGTPNESSVSGGIIANGSVDGTGHHISVQYDPEFMESVAEFENVQTFSTVVSWRDL